MKNNTKKEVLKYALAFSCVILSFAVFFVGYRFLPKAICYSVAQNTQTADEVGKILNISDNQSLPYSDVSQIPEKDKYIIKSENDAIYVFSGDIALYKINAKLSDFPANDIFMLRAGMEIASKDGLCEIVRYLES